MFWSCIKEWYIFLDIFHKTVAFFLFGYYYRKLFVGWKVFTIIVFLAATQSSFSKYPEILLFLHTKIFFQKLNKFVSEVFFSLKLLLKTFCYFSTRLSNITLLLFYFLVLLQLLYYSFSISFLVDNFEVTHVLVAGLFLRHRHLVGISCD